MPTSDCNKPDVACADVCVSPCLTLTQVLAVLTIEGTAATVFRFQDDVHESSAAAMAALRVQRPPPRLLMLTGDREANARAVAAELGITVYSPHNTVHASACWPHVSYHGTLSPR
jgi:cation transport ATPase